MQAPQLLRELLEREVAEHISHLEKRRKELVSLLQLLLRAQLAVCPSLHAPFRHEPRLEQPCS
jgi:hypothetical protein